ncbi:outer membrane beta-barrel protein [Zunongwangia sp. F260]|uniref:Outer membrane beta-barrel protein n=1 Tax=Autumnicola lenta TaxID=3075593 RepID=A0ABU3CM83_9FLAO|nr:outer membrane beta-barrel protein [Zunongwangia sp. F260]MDT0647454.1 outer membrane beta-barrel protein [Zunongwangia sp. F260]
MNKSIAFLLLAFGLFTYGAQAQIKLNNVGVGVSYWNRSYSDANEKYVLISSEADEDFTKGGAMPFISAELNLYRNFSLDGRVGLWTGDFTSEGQFGDLTISESIDQTLIPLSLGLTYNFNELLRDDFNFLVGVGVNRYFVQNKVSRTIEGGAGSEAAETFSGNNYGAYLKTGLEYMFSDSFGLLLEGRYNTGFYTQSFRTSLDAELQSEQISVRGFEIGLSLRYAFMGRTDDDETPEMVE